MESVSAAFNSRPLQDGAVLCIGLLLLYGSGLALFVFAGPIVKWQARIYARWYPHNEDRELLDRLQGLNPFSRPLYGKMSDFVAAASEHPEAFPRVVWFVRLLGLLPLVVATAILVSRW
jgi:hypothetical protein